MKFLEWQENSNRKFSIFRMKGENRKIDCFSIGYSSIQIIRFLGYDF